MVFKRIKIIIQPAGACQNDKSAVFTEEQKKLNLLKEIKV